MNAVQIIDDPSSTFQKEMSNETIARVIKHIDTWVKQNRTDWFYHKSVKETDEVSLTEDLMGLVYTSSSGFAMLGVCNSCVKWDDYSTLEYFALDNYWRVIAVTHSIMEGCLPFYFDLGQIEGAFLPDNLVDNAHSWPEDFSHENGKYIMHCLTCLHDFVGHKRRIQCKLCSEVVAYIEKSDGSVRCKDCLTTPAEISPTWDGQVPVKIYGINLYPYAQHCHECHEVLFKGAEGWPYLFNDKRR